MLKQNYLYTALFLCCGVLILMTSNANAQVFSSQSEAAANCRNGTVETEGNEKYGIRFVCNTNRPPESPKDMISGIDERNSSGSCGSGLVALKGPRGIICEPKEEIKYHEGQGYDVYDQQISTPVANPDPVLSTTIPTYNTQAEAAQMCSNGGNVSYEGGKFRCELFPSSQQDGTITSSVPGTSGILNANGESISSANEPRQYNSDYSNAEYIALMEDECRNHNGVYEVNGRLECGHPEVISNPDAVGIGKNSKTNSSINAGTVESSGAKPVGLTPEESIAKQKAAYKEYRASKIAAAKAKRAAARNNQPSGSSAGGGEDKKGIRNYVGEGRHWSSTSTPTVPKNTNIPKNIYIPENTY